MKGGLFEHPLTQFGFAVLSALLLWPLFGLHRLGLTMAIILTLVVALHELGHLMAFRLMGHKSVRMIFIPILGGVAIGGRPYDTRFEIGFVALMGAGFSALFVLLALSGAQITRSSGHDLASLNLTIFAGFCAVFNLANLAPIWRFDGGQILRQLIQSKVILSGASFVVLMAILTVGLLAGLPVHFVLIAGAVAAILSVVTSGKSVKPRYEMKPMTGNQRALLAGGLGAAIMVHGGGAIWIAQKMM